jgi:hypothetical protein
MAADFDDRSSRSSEYMLKAHFHNSVAALLSLAQLAG